MPASTEATQRLLTDSAPQSTIMFPAAEALRLARVLQPAFVPSHQLPTGGKISMAHEVPALPYDYSALEPYIDTQTMHLHHDKHHQAYVTNLNAAMEKAPELQKQRRGIAQGPGQRARRHPHRGAQQRRRPRQPHHVLEDHGPQRRRRAERRHRRRHQEHLRRFQRVQGEVQRRRAEAVRQRLGVAGARQGRQAAGHEHAQPGQSR